MPPHGIANARSQGVWATPRQLSAISLPFLCFLNETCLLGLCVHFSFFLNTSSSALFDSLLTVLPVADDRRR